MSVLACQLAVIREGRGDLWATLKKQLRGSEIETISLKKQLRDEQLKSAAMMIVTTKATITADGNQKRSIYR